MAGPIDAGSSAAPGPSEAPTARGGAPDLGEYGVTGLKRYGGYVYEEFLPELSGTRGTKVYREMSENDPVVGAVLYAIGMLMRQATTSIKPFSDDQEDRERAEFVESCLNDMSQSLTEVDAESNTMLPYGFAPQELVYKMRMGQSEDPLRRSRYTDGRIGWRKVPLRSQDTVDRWEFDTTGGIRGLYQSAPPDFLTRYLPIEKMLLFRPDTRKGNPEGRSLLRNAYRPWYLKRHIENIEAIGIERDLAGLPTMYVPPEIMEESATPAQKNALAYCKRMVTRIRRDEQEGVVLPALYDEKSAKPLYELKLLTAGGSRQFDTDKVIQRHDSRIAMTVLADVILMGHEKVGSYALHSSKTSLFSLGIGAILEARDSVWNRYAIPRLFAANGWPVDRLPTREHGDLETVDLAELGDYVTKLAGAGAPLFPNADLEKRLLEVAGLPTNIYDGKPTGQVQSPGAPPAAPTAAGAPTEPVQPAADALLKKDTALNGAQVQALADIVSRVAQKQLPRDAAKNMIQVAFDLDEATAEKVLGTAGAGFEPEAPPPRENPRP